MLFHNFSRIVNQTPWQTQCLYSDPINIRFPTKYNAEKLYKSNNTYDIILVLDFNLSPIRKNKGSAIFIHVAKKNYSSTAGCIAVSKKNIKKIVKNINKKTVVNIN